MNSMIFTKTPLKKKKPVIYGTNNMGQYYSNERVPIQNFTTSSVSERIDKNMSNLNVPALTDKNLTKFLEPLLHDESQLLVTNHEIQNVIQMNLETDKNFNSFVNVVSDNETITLTHPIVPNIVTMNIETEKKHFNSFVIDVHEIMDDTGVEDIINGTYSKYQIMEALRVLHLTHLTIENVYQEKYRNINATGIGDFLRGSYFLMQFCDKYHFSYNINMLNHPVSQFLEIYQNKKSLIYSIVSIFDISNFKHVILKDNVLSNIYDYKVNDSLIMFLKNQKKYNNKMYTYIISYPYTPIEQRHKNYMQQLLKPTKEFLTIIYNILNELELVEREYIIIHVRYGDKFLLDNSENIDMIRLNHFKIIQNSIERLESFQQILLISDNNNIKELIIKKYPFIKTHFNQITHTGEGYKLETDKLKNTMLDFYLFSLAKRVLAFSVYKHGSGFSRWVSETYSVPYVCRILR